MSKVCVIDNSTLVILTHLNDLFIFNKLKNLFSRIHIPLKIKEEYEDEEAVLRDPIRREISKSMRLNRGFLSICNQYDTISLAVLKTVKGIDVGEAEAVAQHKKINSLFVISDDLKFIKGLKKADPFIKVIGTLHLIAWLDFLKFLNDREAHLRIIYQQSPFKSKHLRNAYIDIGKQLGITISKNDLSKKTSLKPLGIV